MPTDAAQQLLSDAPLYIRWGPDKCPYAIELKLDLVTLLRRAVIEAATGGLEVGGVLVGSLPTLQVQTLRIEDVELIARRPEDGATFTLNGGGERFAEARRRARSKECSAVGLFRSHLRSGPLRPSLADRTLLAGEFKEPIYALFLVQNSDPFTAAFFVASNGPLPAEMSVRAFNLNVADFESLPEIEPELHSKQYIAASVPKRLGFGALTAVFLIALCVAGVLLYFNQSVFLKLMPSDNSLGLMVQSQDGLLRIGWNHAANDLDQSRGAMLTIRNSGVLDEHQIQLGLDELRLGVVAIESRSPKIEVKLTLLNSGPSISETKVWTR